MDEQVKEEIMRCFSPAPTRRQAIEKLRAMHQEPDEQMQQYICRATTRPPRPSSTAECLRLIARLRGEQASAASWEPRPPFEATEMD